MHGFWNSSESQMEPGSIQRPAGIGRPYRSHLHPACLPCKRRKSRCRTRDSSASCLMCQVHGTSCVFPQLDYRSAQREVMLSSPRRLAAKPRNATTTGSPSHSAQVLLSPDVNRQIRTRHSNSHSHSPGSPARGNPQTSYTQILGTGTEETPSNLRSIVAETGENSSHIISPAVVADSEFLESYLSTIPDARRTSLIRTNVSSNRPVRPVLFNTVSRRPLGVSSSQSIPAAKCELIEKYLEPSVEHVVNLFFEYANICFPVFDEASFKDVYHTHKDKISPALLSNLYANALIYWNNSPALSALRSPDIRYIWNQANEALHSELFLSPGISTVMAIILNVCGRPSTSIFGNGGMVGTAVALSNALGLNRDPSNWNISPLEKKFRIRIWWLVVLHDRWCSLAYGTPLQIHRAQYDVAFPVIDDLCTPDSTPAQVAAASVFVALTTLTEVLAQYLEHVYNVSSSGEFPFSKMSAMDLERALSAWEESLSDGIRRIVVRGTNLNAPGAANFRLAYLAVKLLLRRLQLDADRPAATTIENYDEDGTGSPFYIQAQRAAEEIVHLMQELDESHFRGFWIPVNALCLTSATTFLLRTALRKRSSATSVNAPLNISRDMIQVLRSHRQRFAWDLADDCLAACGELVDKITCYPEMSTGGGGGGGDIASDSILPCFQENGDISQSVLDELFVDFPGLADTIGI